MTITAFENLVHVEDRQGHCLRITDRYTASLILTFSGRIRFAFDGGEVTSDAGHAVFLPRGACYENTCLAAAESYMFNFRTLETDLPYAAFPRPSEDFCRKRCTRAAAALSRPDGGYAVMAELYGLLDALCAPPPLTGRGRLAAEGLHFLRTHYDDPALSAADVAAALHISEAYLYAVFRAELHTTPHAALHDLRMDRARELLRECRPVSEIAAAVGYRDLPPFSRAFRRRYGAPPTQYKE